MTMEDADTFRGKSLGEGFEMLSLFALEQPIHSLPVHPRAPWHDGGGVAYW
jgi:hypothetical protein